MRREAPPVGDASLFKALDLDGHEECLVAISYLNQACLRQLPVKRLHGVVGGDHLRAAEADFNDLFVNERLILS